MGMLHGWYYNSKLYRFTARYINWANTLIMRKYNAQSILVMVKTFKRDGVLEYLLERGYKEDAMYLRKNYFKDE